MKKIFISIFLSVALTSIAFADLDGERLYDQNFCQYLNPNNVSEVKLLYFPDSSLKPQSSSYNIAKMVSVAYPSMQLLNASFNGRAVGVLSSEVFMCPKRYSYNASGSFPGGTIFNFGIPTEFGQIGTLRVIHGSKSGEQSYRD